MSEPTTDPAIEATRRRNERWIAAFLVLFSSAFGATSAVTVASGLDESTAVVLITTVLYGGYYLLAWRRAHIHAPTAAGATVRTVLEVSVPTLVTLGDAVAAPATALSRNSVLVYVIAIFLPVLRLRPRLALAAGLLAAAQWFALWLALRGYAPVDDHHGQLMPMLNRSLLLAFCGVLAWRIAASHAQLNRTTAHDARRAEQMRHAVGAYLPGPVADRVMAGDLQLRTERRVVTVLFVDIRGFTRFAEARAPEEVVAKLNLALEAFSREVQQHGGMVNKFLGDGLMALFGAPLASEDHALAATEAAIGIAHAANGLAASGAYPDLRIGVGVHTGQVLVGDLGGTEHREYTAIGDVVNVAARTESMTKEHRCPVLITEAVQAQLPPSIPLRAAGRTTLRGRSHDIALYEVLLTGDPPERTRADAGHEAQAGAGEVPVEPAPIDRLQPLHPPSGP